MLSPALPADAAAHGRPARAAGRAHTHAHTHTHGNAHVGPFTPDLAALHGSLLRFARSRVHNRGLAEDAVSETMLAALESGAGFASPARATAWVYGILRHKLVDQLRHEGRETPAGENLPEHDTRSLDWYAGGAWCGVAGPRPEPEQAYRCQQLMALVLRCCEQLPLAHRQAFVMRELLDEDPARICQTLGVTEGHLCVLVHRARQRLRQLLRAQWLLPHEASAPRQ